MTSWQKRHLLRFILGMVGYAILLPLSIMVVDNGRIEQPWLAALVMLLPMGPFLNAMTAVVRNVQRQDELQQRIHLEAVLFTTLLTGGLTFSYGLLEASELVPPLPTVLIAPFMIAAWGISNLILSRKYA